MQHLQYFISDNHPPEICQRVWTVNDPQYETENVSYYLLSNGDIAGHDFNDWKYNERVGINPALTSLERLKWVINRDGALHKHTYLKRIIKGTKKWQCL